MEVNSSSSTVPPPTSNVNKNDNISTQETLSSTTTNINTNDTEQESKNNEIPVNNTSPVTNNTSDNSNNSKGSKEADRINKINVTRSKKRMKVENPFISFEPKVIHLVYWENPIHSGVTLAIGLSFLIFISYFSFFDILCFSLVSLIGLNTIYVVGRKQINSILNQEPVNPYEDYLSDKPWYVDYELVDKYIDDIINGINFLLVETQKVVLVDDPLRSAKHALLVYFVWKFSSWLGLNTLLGIALVIGFVVPKLYSQNKVLVDEKLDQANKLSSIYYKRGIDVVKEKTGGVVSKLQSNDMIKNLTKSQNSPKEE